MYKLYSKQYYKYFVLVFIFLLSPFIASATSMTGSNYQVNGGITPITGANTGATYTVGNTGNPISGSSSGAVYTLNPSFTFNTPTATSTPSSSGGSSGGGILSPSCELIPSTTTINAGESANISWQLGRATQVTILGSTHNATDSITVTPRVTSTYYAEVSALGGLIIRDCYTTIIVNAKPLPPTKVPTEMPNPLIPKVNPKPGVGENVIPGNLPVTNYPTQPTFPTRQCFNPDGTPCGSAKLPPITTSPSQVYTPIATSSYLQCLTLDGTVCPLLNTMNFRNFGTLAMFIWILAFISGVWEKKRSHEYYRTKSAVRIFFASLKDGGKQFEIYNLFKREKFPYFTCLTMIVFWLCLVFVIYFRSMFARDIFWIIIAFYAAAILVRMYMKVRVRHTLSLIP